MMITATDSLPGPAKTSLRPYAPMLGALWIAEMTGSFESAMILAALKYLIQDFGDPALVGWLITSYLIVGAASAAVVGRLGDLFGRRRILLLTLLVALIGSLISAYATSFAMLLLGRILQGLTGAVLALCVGLVRENLPRHHVSLGIGLFSIVLQAPGWTGLGLGLSAFAAGLAKLPSNILSTLAGPLSGWLTGRGGGGATMLLGGVLASLGWTLIFFFHGDVMTIIFVVCVISFGTTILFAVGPTILSQAVASDWTSEVSGMLSVTRGLFQGIGAMMVTSILAIEVVRQPASDAAYPTEFAFLITVGVLIALSLVAAATALALPKTQQIADEEAGDVA